MEWFVRVASNEFHELLSSEDLEGAAVYLETLRYLVKLPSEIPHYVEERLAFKVNAQIKKHLHASGKFGMRPQGSLQAP